MNRSLVSFCVLAVALSGLADTTVESAAFPCALDLDPVWVIESKDVSPLMYSAQGWDCEPVDRGVTVGITAQAGSFEEGKWMPAESDPEVIASGLADRGTCNWDAKASKAAVCQVVHKVSSNSPLTINSDLIAYFVFTDKGKAASSERLAVTAPVTHEFAVANDADNPWAYIGGDGEGMRSADGLAVGVASTLAFTISGKGAFSFDCTAAGGLLAVYVDDGLVETVSAADDWTPKSYDVALGAHRVRLVFTPAGAGALAQVNGVRWRKDDATYDETEFGVVRVDLREGVRVLVEYEDRMPFTYSHTNFTGFAGASAAAVAKVSVVELTGEGPDVSTWTDEIPGTAKTLVERAGEGLVPCRISGGVWKATFEVFENATLIRTETAILDFRRFKARGFALFLR